MLTQSRKQLSSSASACPFIGSIRVELDSLFFFLVLKFYYGFEALVFYHINCLFGFCLALFVCLFVFKQTALLPELRWKRRGRPLWALVFLRWNSSFLLMAVSLAIWPHWPDLKATLSRSFPCSGGGTPSEIFILNHISFEFF